MIRIRLCLREEFRTGIVYDVGANNGDDTEYYLKKGFRVVAIEANPALVNHIRTRFAGALQNGRLVVLNVAVGDGDYKSKLYVNSRDSKLSTLVKPFHYDEQWTDIEIDVTKLSTIVKEHGHPAHVKLDIEGADVAVLREMFSANASLKAFRRNRTRSRFCVCLWQQGTGSSKLSKVNSFIAGFAQSGRLMAPCSNTIFLKARVQARLETIYQAAGWGRKRFFTTSVNTGLAGRTYMHFGIEYTCARSPELVATLEHPKHMPGTVITWWNKIISMGNSGSLRIALTADPELPVPPVHYGGIERIVDMLARGLVARGHEVTVFAHADSATAGRLIPWPGRASRSALDSSRNAATLARHVLARRFDLVHSFSRVAYLAPILPLPIPKLMTYQRQISPRSVRLGHDSVTRHAVVLRDQPLDDARRGRNRDLASRVQRRAARDLRISSRSGPDAPLVFLGRVEEIKGPHLAIEIARRASVPLVIAGNVPPEHQRVVRSEHRAACRRRARCFPGPVNDAQKNELLGRALASTDANPVGGAVRHRHG